MGCVTSRYAILWAKESMYEVSVGWNIDVLYLLEMEANALLLYVTDGIRNRVKVVTNMDFYLNFFFLQLWVIMVCPSTILILIK